MYISSKYFYSIQQYCVPYFNKNIIQSTNAYSILQYCTLMKEENIHLTKVCLNIHIFYLYICTKPSKIIKNYVNIYILVYTVYNYTFVRLEITH